MSDYEEILKGYCRFICRLRVYVRVLPLHCSLQLWSELSRWNEWTSWHSCSSVANTKKLSWQAQCLLVQEDHNSKWLRILKRWKKFAGSIMCGRKMVMGKAGSRSRLNEIRLDLLYLFVWEEWFRIVPESYIFISSYLPNLWDCFSCIMLFSSGWIGYNIVRHRFIQYYIQWAIRIYWMLCVFQEIK